MWILESNGDFLQGKRMWLKPGKKYLFGRVKKDGVRFAIDHKTVSRKHFVITVDEVKDEDVGRVHARTKITISDEHSKAGTNIDGELIKNKSQELKKAVTSIRPGSCPDELLITWLPCTFTFGLLKKEIKNGVLKTKQERVKELDIKAICDYVIGETTHLVAQKRNTPKGLQALLDGKPIVSEAYIDALIYASTPTNLQEEENLSPLEIDFDDAWPDPTQHLPPVGKEPTNKPAEAYKPDPARAKVFEKYVFFFFDQTQYDALLSPITTGHGKALMFKVKEGTTTGEEGLAFVRSAVRAHGRAIIIKLNETPNMQPWLVEYIEDLCSRLGQEPAVQSNLLDTILANDASQLCKPRIRPLSDNRAAVPALESASARSQEPQVNEHREDITKASANDSRMRDSSVEAPSSVPLSRAQSVDPDPIPENRANTQQSSMEDDNPRPRKRPRFVPVKKALDPFDDDFNPDAIAAYDEEPSAVQTQSHTPRAARSQIEGNNLPIKEEPTSRATRNKSPGPAEVADSGDDLDELLPAVAAMRKEKQRQELEAKQKGLPVKSALSQAGMLGKAKQKKEVRLLDVRGAARAQREAEDEADKKERQEFDDLQAEDEDMSGPANLVKVVEYKLPVRERSSNGTNGYRGETWKLEWDGRKNFKGFRRARDVANGTAGIARRPRDKIIVPLVSVKKDTYGLGDKYWEKTAEDKEHAAREKERKKRATQRSSQSQKQDSRQSQRSTTVIGDSDSDDGSGVQAEEDETEQVSPETDRLQREAEGVLDHAVDIDAPRQTRGGDTQTQSTKRSTASTSRSTQGGKRPASSTPSGRTTLAKKQKILPVTVVHGSDSAEQDDDSDDMKFKFGRGRKARAAKS